MAIEATGRNIHYQARSDRDERIGDRITGIRAVPHVPCDRSSQSVQAGARREGRRPGPLQRRMGLRWTSCLAMIPIWLV
jgi:hypothetical protein